MRHCYVLRVFTRDGAGGNHLGVVPDITGLTRDTMQAVAADLGFSETVFIDWRQPSMPKARIFTPTAELPFAGHPLVGAAWVLTRMGPGGVDAIECGVGAVAIENVGDLTWIRPPFEQPVSRAEAPAWLEDVVDASMVEMPLPYTVVEVERVEIVESIDAPADVDALYVWSWERPDERVRARFFAGGLGVVEDPATGSAAVALAASLRRRGRSSAAITVHQGAEMGHPSAIELAWGAGGVRVGGAVARDEVRVLEV